MIVESQMAELCKPEIRIRDPVGVNDAEVSNYNNITTRFFKLLTARIKNNNHLWLALANHRFSCDCIGELHQYNDL